MIYDAPPAFIALVRHEVTTTLRAHRRYLAADLATTADTPEAWALLEREVDGLTGWPSGSVCRAVLSRVCVHMGRGHADTAIAAMADDCGLSVEAWADDVRHEMSRAARAA
ncbi:MAG: hypothetical protein ACEQSX_10730 [Baekduiaceae bacterium]